eukprot:CAMPEP_0174695938 /NCGR_PEP_ID=MMETSP1094-20130205/2210_1 /TAXON_ID=156173 /ORGANISM="Chrysochromulina brevifilum, Strain UTEX LB 985" /LENGTH=355 /DNA_ID=CAMNT_0015892581 /DNA_START=40 /DNA_END=1104 /DNA_ORIENTATION=+
MSDVAREKGNAAYVDEEYKTAISHYSQAIAANPEDADAFSKRAAAHLQLKQYTEAVSDATVSVKLQATPKAYVRKGQAAFALGEFEAAKGAFTKALEIVDDKVIRRWARKCDAELALEAMPPAPAPTATPPVVTNPMAPPPAVAPASNAMTSDPSKIRNDWYQTQSDVIINVLAKNVPSERVSVEFSESEVDVTIKLEGGSDYVHSFTLFHKIKPAESTYTVGTAKIELKLKKHTPGKWESLEGSGDADVTVSSLASVPDEALQPASKKVYSGSSKDWDRVESEMKKAEEDEKPEGEEALNKLFRDIYGRADEDTRRAMNKSFQTSGGTVLSTNWGDVKEKDYEKDRTAPDGQEW